MTLNKKEVGQMLALVVAGAALGLGINFFAREPLPLFRPLGQDASAAAAPAGEIDADFVLQVGSAPGTVLLDARAAAAFRSGHIPGAVSLPLGEFAAAFPALEPRLREAELLVVYCSDPACGDSPELARRLWSKGLKGLLLYKGGMEDWKQRGHAVER